jgi:hypothetical protein
MDLSSHSGDNEDDMYLIAQDDGKMYIASDIDLNVCIICNINILG